jgi:hypothetical protein
MDIAVGSLIAIGLLAAALFVGLRWLVRSFSRYRGQKIVTCPETKRPAVVEVDALHASLTSTLGPPDIRLKNCWHWPINEQCGQECLTDLDVAPERCLVSGVLMRWFRGKKCVYCRNPFAELHWIDHKPGFRSPDENLVGWNGVHMGNLWKVLETHEPVCWNCYIAQKFRLEHPDLVVYRPWRTDVSVATDSSHVTEIHSPPSNHSFGPKKAFRSPDQIEVKVK